MTSSVEEVDALLAHPRLKGMFALSHSNGMNSR
jgi:hypothetical protein